MANIPPSTIILGRGIEMAGDQAYLSIGSVERADRATQHYFDNRAAYDDGGHSRLADEAFSVSEAELMADRMVGNGVPYGIIEREMASTSTLGNFILSAPMLMDREITEENPTGRCAALRSLAARPFFWP
jgi:hypothetical protein